MKKRIVSLLLVFCMVITLVPANVLADEVKGLAETTAGQTQTAGTTAAKPENPFADVKSGSWYEAAVLYARANGFFDGTSATTFEPEGSMTRAMFVTVLGRMAGVEAADYAGATDFIDVAEGTWYAPFVKWAARYGITTGTGNGKFSPDGRITREEMAVFFVRYFETFDAMPKADTTVTTKPADLDEVSSWAQDAAGKLWALGLLNGDGVNFAPKDKATRAQTAALCQRTDKAVETWYSEPGVKSERVSVEPGSGQESGDKKPEEQKPSGGGSSGGTTVTTHYEVSFVVEGASMPKSTVAAGTRISSLSTPTVEGKVFLGWYYDSALTRAAGTNDTVNGNMTLYAKLGEVMAVNANEAETPNYVTVTVPAANVSGYTFGISGYTEGCIDSFINVTANNEAVSYNVPNGTVSFAPQQGQTYRVELKADSDARFVVDGAEQAPSVRVLNIVTEKVEVDNLTLSDGVKYIPKKDVTGMSTSLDGLFRTSLVQDAEGNTQPVTPVAQTGSFTYAAGGLAVGDTVAIYEGVSPADRSIRTDNDGAVAYVQITAASGTTYTYKTADSADVLFTPDVLPFPTDQGWDTDGVADNDAATVRVENMTYTDDQYTEMGLDSQTTIDVGDFLAFYSGTLGGESQSRGYARITRVETVTQDGEEYYVLTYEGAEEADVFAAMDLYSTRDEEIELTAAQRAEIEDDMVRQARESGFAEQAAQYLTELALETDGFQELSDMGLSSYSITDADGALVQSCDLTLYSAVSRPLLDKDHINISATVNVGSLKHFADRYGIRAELSIEFSTTVEGKNGNSIEINMTAVFEQEVLLTVNTSGGAIWKWKWIFPYIYDYRLNANIDVGTYTGIAITATAKTAGEDDDGFDWKSVTGLAPEEKIINIGQQIKDLMEQKESFFGEDVDWKAGEGGGLADKYSAMMEDADESWIDLVRKEIFAQEGNVDPFHILCYGISADFVVKANLYVTMGMSFEFGVARRYNFSILLFHKQSTNETIDLEEAHYNFDFYVMGTLGVRVGVEFEIGVGLFSLKLDSIGITAEAGAYAQLWGYFYYHLSWTQSGGKESNAAGAMYVEIGLYLTITFKAQLFSSDKLTYQPVLYDGQWPLWSAGAQENVYDFAYDEDDDRLGIDLKSVRSVTLPSSLFDMSYMDMKTGELYDGDENPAGNYDDATESHFTIELSNGAFRYDPAGNTVTITPDASSIKESCDVTIRWKNGALAFTSEPIERTLHIEWSDPANVQYYAFDSNGGSYVPMIVTGKGAAITAPAAPVKQGYTFAGWYSDSALRQSYAIPAVMPAFSGTKGMMLYAKWEPAHDTPYRVEHYLQELNGTYTKANDDLCTGTTLERTAVSPRTGTVDGVNYDNYACAGVTQQTIKADGSAVVRVYYERKSYDVTFTYGTFRSAELPDIVYTIKYGGTAYAPALALQGYTFEGFEGFTADAQSGGVTVTGDMSFAAQWLPRDDTPYRIERYAQRVDGVAGYLLIDDERAIESRTGTTGSAIDFGAWSKDGFTYDHAEVNGSTVSSAAIGADGKTVVKLYYDRARCDLRFETNGGTLPEGSGETEQVYFGARVRLAALPQPVKAGYVFRGWHTDAACENAFAGGTMPVNGLTLYAKWEAGQNTAYKVEHYLQNADGSYPDAASQTENLTGATGAAVEAVVQTIPGYHEDTENESAVKSGTIAADGTTVLRVYYARDTYTLTFRNEGEADVVSTRRWGERVSEPALTVTKPGYALSWSPARPETMPQSDSTYTAVWTAKGDIAYKVEHYQQNADDDGYTLRDTDPLTGATDAEVTAAARNYDHFVLNESAAGTVSSGVIAADGSLVLRLYYDRETLRVTFDAGEGGTLTDEAEKTFRYGQTFSVTDPTRPDYHFIGWYLPEGGQFNAQTVTESMALTARWGAQPVDFTVEHYYMDTTGTMPSEANETDRTSEEVDTDIEVGTLKKSGLSEAFTCVKARVSGVYGVADDTEFTDLSETVTVTKDMTVKLYYDRAQYALEWVFNGGTASNDYTGSGGAYEIYYDTALVLPAPAKRGHDFGGWYDNETFNESGKLAAGAKMPAAAQTYYAKWTPSVYGITYPGIEGSAPDVTLPTTHTYGTATEIPNLTRTGYVFNGWVVNGEGAAQTGLTLGAEDYTGAIALTAAWTAERYAIIYELDGGVNAAGNPAQYTVDQTITLEDPTKPGYTFKGWYADKDFTTLTVGIPVGSTEAKTFYAKWEQNPYKITWNVNEGDELTGGGYTVEAFYGNPITAPGDPARRGYTFGGWYTDGSNFAENTKFKTGDKMPEGDVTYYAKWTAIEYTITYNLDGGTNVSGNPAQYTVETGKITLVAPTKTGYRFDGWYTDDTYSTKVTEIAADSTDDVTLYAKWTIKQYTVTWETNGGNDLTGSNYTTTADYGTAIVRPDDPTKEADAQYTYTFGGWYTDRALTQPLDDNATVPAENMTVYAKWNTTAQTYTVKWYGVNNPWWGSAAKKEPYVLLRTDTYDYGTLLLENAPEATKDAYDAYYYELEGWHAGSETGELLTEASIVTGDAEYYPSFLKKITMCTITFDLGDAGGTIDPVTVEYGTFSSSVFDKIQKPDTMARYGQFKGWYKKGESHVGQSYGGRIVESMTVEAGWSELYAYDESQLRAALSEDAYRTSTVRLRADIALADEVPITKSITVTGEPLATDNKNTNYTLSAAEGKTAFRIGKTTLTDITARPTVTIKNLTIDGGARGLLVYIADVNLENVTIENCDATTDTHSTKISNGGAIYMDTKESFGTVTGRLCTFRNNRAYNGGAIYIKKGALETNGCKFLDNTATSDGGAVMLTDNAQQSGIGAGTFQNNHAGGYGGALYVGRVRVSLSLVTFDTGNTAGQKGKLIAIHTYLDNNKNKYVSYTDCWDKTQSANNQHSDNLYSSKGAYVTRDKL